MLWLETKLYDNGFFAHQILPFNGPSFFKLVEIAIVQNTALQTPFDFTSIFFNEIIHHKNVFINGCWWLCRCDNKE